MEVGASAGPLWRDAFGTRTFDDAEAVSNDTAFDLASVTKVIATTTILMDLIRIRAIGLDDPVASFFDEWRGRDRESVTVRQLLEHASGLPARLIDAPPEGRRPFEHDICALPLEYVPGTRSIYSDLDFILLGFLAEKRGGGWLYELFERIWTGLGPATAAGFKRSPASGAAPTRPLDEDRRRGRLLNGEVHDNYAAALGGFAGHAGLFGTAEAVGTFARVVLRAARGDASGPEPFSPARVGLFAKKTSVPNSSRALGWDTMLTSSSCGSRMSATAFGHVGFTGTSLWIDPPRDRYFVLLTNRACDGGSLDQMRTVRRAFHDALGDF